MVREEVQLKDETRLQSTPFTFLNHVPTWDVSKFYRWQVEHPHWSSLELWISCFATMVFVAYFLFSSNGIPTNIREVLLSLGGCMRHYLDIAQ